MRARFALFAFAAFCLSLAAWIAGCGSGGSGGGGNGAPGDDGGGGDATLGGDASNPCTTCLGGGDGSVTGVLTIDAIPTVAVSDDLTAGTTTVVPPSLTLVARLNGSPVQAAWSLDRGELGALDPSSGAFVPSGTVAGTGNVVAQLATLTAKATLTVTIHATANGGASTAGQDAGLGGFGGVGGEGPGGPVADAGALTGGPTSPAAGATLAWLYPYDGTVWPRGLFAPLLMWSTDATHVADGVYVHLKEASYEFEGTYALTGSADARSRQPIDATAWKAATNSNGGKSDPLTLEIKISSGGVVYGPITETWSVAQGVLQGTVYYNSYYTALNQEASGVNVVNGFTGAVLSIQPRSPQPTLAIPSTYGHCNVCHTVSADGKTLFTQTDESGSSDTNLDFGASFDMADAGALIEDYYSETADGGTSNHGKFTFSAPYPDGTFVLGNDGENYHTYSTGSTLWSRTGANEIASNGFKTAVTNAVTPIFSPDGKHVAFDFWSGAGANGVTASAGHSIAAMDFDCGAPAGSVACAPGATPTFSGLRELFGLTNDPSTSHWAGWPSFVPDATALVFHHTLAQSGAAFPFNTDSGAQAEIWYTDVPAVGGASHPRLLCALNGYAPGCATTPQRVIPDHSFGGSSYEDTTLNYEANVNPVPSGGYYWVVFTSRRRYGNVAAGNPYGGAEGDPPTATSDPFTKKLWVAAIDMTPGATVDPSHPAFYLPGQELKAGNMRGFWSVDPCKANGATCETGEDCCNGFCRAADDGGALVCSAQPAGCSQVYESCQTDSDCCTSGAGVKCINGRCAVTVPK